MQRKSIPKHQRNIGLRYWRASRALSISFGLLWAGVCFGLIFFAAEMQDLSFFGWSFSFYALAQGILLFFVALLAGYLYLMRRLNRLYATREQA